MHCRIRSIISSPLLALMMMVSISINSYAETTFESGKHQARLVELFTSQGCSSCPPAESWLNNLSEDEQLWKTIVPVAFHVDYWDYLGWKDPFSSKRYSQKQRNYQRTGNVYSVYTPGFVVNGEEWKGYYKRKPLPSLQPSLATLKATLSDNELDIVFTPKQKTWLFPIDINIAVLGHNIQTKVTSGENARRALKQDFVVLNYEKLTSTSGVLKHSLSHYKKEGVKRYALAIWASHPLSARTVQAIGGWLE